MKNEQTEKNKKLILVVEDDSVSRALLLEVLKKKDVDHHFAKSGEDARDFIANHGAPHIVLMDIRLPDISGIDLTKEILSQYPEVIIIAQTAFANMSMEENCMRAGMKAFLTKPLNRSLVESVLDSFLT